jgi:uncharacterized protein YndB with AHSA1/START domain
MAAVTRWSIPQSAEIVVVVEATPDQVYAVVSDVTRIAEWSHECRQADWLGDTTGPVVGGQFRGRNRVNRFGWSRICTITALEPGRVFAYRTSGGFPSDSTAWSFELEPVEGGTRVTQRYQILKFARWMELLTIALVPPHRDRSDALRADLVRLGEVASASS